MVVNFSIGWRRRKNSDLGVPNPALEATYIGDTNFPPKNKAVSASPKKMPSKTRDIMKRRRISLYKRGISFLGQQQDAPFLFFSRLTPETGKCLVLSRNILPPSAAPSPPKKKSGKEFPCLLGGKRVLFSISVLLARLRKIGRLFLIDRLLLILAIGDSLSVFPPKKRFFSWRGQIFLADTEKTK